MDTIDKSKNKNMFHLRWMFITPESGMLTSGQKQSIRKKWNIILGDGKICTTSRICLIIRPLAGVSFCLLSAGFSLISLRPCLLMPAMCYELSPNLFPLKELPSLFVRMRVRLEGLFQIAEAEYLPVWFLIRLAGGWQIKPWGFLRNIRYSAMI